MLTNIMNYYGPREAFVLEADDGRFYLVELSHGYTECRLVTHVDNSAKSCIYKY